MQKRYLILAEGFSGDPHHGKTMRGVLRYRREDVVAIVDSTRAGETEEGLPVVASVNNALRFDATTVDDRVVWQPYGSLPAILAKSNGQYRHEAA